MIRLLCLGLLNVTCVLGIMAEQLPELRERKHAVLVLAGGGGDLPGDVVRIEGTTIVFRGVGDDAPVYYQGHQYAELLQPITAPQIISERARILLASDQDKSLEIVRTLRWGAEQGALAPSIALAVAAVGRYPNDQRLAQLALKLVEDGADAGNLGPEQFSALESIAAGGLENNSRWEDGYRVLAKVYRQQNRRSELAAIIQQWSKNFPASQEANQLMAELARESGDHETARQSYYRAYTYRDDMSAGVDYAAMSLLAGEVGEAGRVARELLEAGVEPQQNQLLIGITDVHAGRNSEGRDLLEAALAQGGGIDSNLESLGLYHLGLAHYRLGDLDAATTLWNQLSGPAARMALAIVGRQPIEDRDLEALTPELMEVAAVQNASVALERQDHLAAVGAVGNLIGDRPLFIKHISQMLAEGATEGAVATLQAHAGDESLRWQLYGHLIAQRYDRALDIVGLLPPDDTYVTLCRIFIAEARGQRETARALFQSLGTSETLLPEYQAKLADLFDAADDQVRHYDFNWPEGFALAQGWRSQGRGTGVTASIASGNLVLGGRQSAAADPVTRAWCLVSPDRLYQASAVLDYRDMGEGIGGVELLDEQQVNGIAYAVSQDGQLVWRQCNDGVWGEWNQIDSRINGSRITLEIRYEHRFMRVFAVIEDRRIALGESPSLNSEYLCFGVFGYSQPGVEWTLLAEDVRIQVQPAQSGSLPVGRMPAERGRR